MPRVRNRINVVARRRPRLNKPQVKQVQRIIESNKRIKNYYAPIIADFTDVNTATQLSTYFQELTGTVQGDNSTSRSEMMIFLKSYNIKFGLSNYTNDASAPSTLMVAMPFRVIIARSKVGPLADINDIAGSSINTFYQQPDPDKYQVYTDEVFSVSGNASSGTSASMNISFGFLPHIYKSFKNKKCPHLKVGYDAQYSATQANKSPIYMKILVDPGTNAIGDTYNFSLNGFCHLKWFDKE